MGDPAGGPGAPAQAPAPIKADEQFSFVSTERAPGNPNVVFQVSFWRATAQEPCTAVVSAVGAPAHLEALKASVARGYPSARLSVGAELLSRCSRRFVYLDGSDGIAGQWGEWIGSGVESVVHSVRVRSSSASELNLELRPGIAPTKAAEVARIETMLVDVEKAGATGSLIADVAEKRSRFELELGKVRAKP